MDIQDLKLGQKLEMPLAKVSQKNEKYEWRKEERKIYLPKSKPELIQIPGAKYFEISGVGNPNLEDFSERVSVLYSLSYAVRMMPKNGSTPDGYFEYTVYPLQGIWDNKSDTCNKDTLNKDDFIYTIAIKQPQFVTDEIFTKALEIASKKKPHPLQNEVKLITREDTLCVQLMHTGSYDSEPDSFKKMNIFLMQNRLERKSTSHQEIYIKPKKDGMTVLDLEKLNTVLRYECRKVV